MKSDLLTLRDLTGAEIFSIFDRAAHLKADRKAGYVTDSLNGRTVGMLFNKPSTRTRVSFEAGIYELGGNVVFLHAGETQISRGEPIEHSAKVLSRYLHALVIRTYAQAELEEMAVHAGIPVVNALTDDFHPCQVLSDMFTVWERLGELNGRRVAWVGDGNNVAQSWINAASIMDFELVLAVPEGYDPKPEIMATAENGNVTIVRDPATAVKNAAVINTDVWASMGQEEEAAQRIKAFRRFQVNEALLAHAPADVLVLHCLPAHLGEEITPGVLDGPNSVVFDQAENKLHVQKALLEFLILGPFDQ